MTAAGLTAVQPGFVDVVCDLLVFLHQLVEVDVGEPEHAQLTEGALQLGAEQADAAWILGAVI